MSVSHWWKSLANRSAVAGRYTRRPRRAALPVTAHTAALSSDCGVSSYEAGPPRTVRPRRRLPHPAPLARQAELLEPRQLLTVFVVDTRFDLVDPNDGVTSLREALAAAGDETNHPGHDTIVFDDALNFAMIHADYIGFDSDGAGINNPDPNGRGQFVIDSDLTLDASSVGFVRIGHERGFNQYHRIFDVAAGVTVTFDSVFVQGGDSNDGNGAGIHNAGNLTLKNSAVGSNFALGASGGALKGGGIYNAAGATLTLNNTHIGEIALDAEFLTELGFSADRFAETEEAERTQYQVFVYRGEDIIGKSTTDTTLLAGNASYGSGGGIYNDGTLHITNNSVIRANRVDSFNALGAGVYNAGIMTVSDSTVEAHPIFGEFTHRGADEGGGVYNAQGAELTVERSTFRNNAALTAGGAIYNRGMLSVTETTFDGNHAENGLPDPGTPSGGAIYNFGGSGNSISRSTFINNSAWYGGGVYSVASNFSLRFVTLFLNDAERGGALYAGGPTGRVQLTRTTVTGNSASLGGGVWTEVGVGLQETLIAENIGTNPDIAARGNGSVVTSRRNLIGDTAGTVFGQPPSADDLLNVDPRLGALGDYGSPTQTYSLLPDSPAIGPDTDIGAFQFVPPATMRVDTLDDEEDGFYGPGAYTLREAIGWANHTPGADEIGFNADFLRELGEGLHTIDLTGGQLEITDDLTLRGPGADRLALSGLNLERLLRVASGVSVTIAGLTLRDGRAENFGGAVLNEGDLTILRSRLTNNTAINRGDSLAGGGAIYSTGSLTVDSSTIDGNTAASARGGGIRAQGPVLVTNSTISGNSADLQGGGVWITGNDSHQILSSTVTDNTADVSGGLYFLNGSVEVGNSIIAANSASTHPDVIDRAAVSLGYNLIGDAPAGSGFVDGTNGDQVGSTTTGVINPLLGTLRNLGGTTPVHGLLPGSPAIEAANPNDFPRFDQRGVARPIDVNPDTGAYEYLAPNFPTETIIVDSLDGFSDGLFTTGEMSLTEAVLFVNDDPNLTRIEFAADLFDGVDAPRIIQLDVPQLFGLDIQSDVTIAGPGADKLRIEADGSTRVFTVGSGSNKNLTVAIRGLAMAGAGGVAAGGAMANYGTLTLDEVFVTENEAAAGGGIFNFGTLTVTNSTFADNYARNNGGAISNIGVATFSNSTLSGNTAVNEGGAIFTQSFSGMNGDTSLNHVTVTRNTAALGGGLASQSGTSAAFSNSIIAGNTATTDDADLRDASGSTHSLGGNLIGVGEGLGFALLMSDQSGTAAAPLVPLMTDLAYPALATIPLHSLLPERGGNPAVNGGLAVYGEPTDQRGVARNEDGGYDVGAIELGAIDTIEFTWDSVLVVDRYDDTVDGIYSKGELTLREAVVLANAFDATTPTMVNGVAHDVILFCNGLQDSLRTAQQSGTPQQLELRRGPLDVQANVIIDPFFGVAAEARDRDLVVIDGGGTDRVFVVSEAANAVRVSARLHNLTLQGGSASGEGGAILNYGDLALNNVVVQQNASDADGGGLAALEGIVDIRDSVFRGNTADSGGALYTNAGTYLSVQRSTIDGNSASGFGGGVHVRSDTANFYKSTISNNAGNSGGGLFARNTSLRLQNVTVSGNTASIGGGFAQVGGTAFLVHATITDNGIPNTIDSSGAFSTTNSHLTLANTIIAGNDQFGGSASDGDNGGGTIRSLGGNLFGDTSSFDRNGNYVPDATDQTGVDPMLGPLADNGGSTWTHRLNPASPAIDSGNETFSTLTDQRDRARVDIVDPVNGGTTIPDIGAYEVQRLEGSQFRFETSGSQFGPGEPLTYGFGFDDGRRSSTVDPAPKFLGAKWDTGPLTYGKIETGAFGAKYGGELKVDFSGRLGFEMGFYVNSGSVDVGYQGDVNYVIDAAPDASQAAVSAFVEILDGDLTTISPKIGAYLDLVIEVDADVSATGCLVGCVSADLIDIHVDTGLELLAVNRQMTDDVGRPLFLNDFGEPLARDSKRDRFYDLDGNEVGSSFTVGPVIPLFDGDVRYLELPIQEIAEGVIKAAKSAREKVKEVLEDRKATKELDDAKKERDRADSELTRQNERLRDAEARQRNPASGDDFLRARQEVVELAGKDYADAVDAGTELPPKKGTIAESENALINAKRRQDAAEDKVRRRQDAEANKKKSKFKTQNLGLVLDVGAADGPLLGAQLGVSVGANIGPFSVTRNIGTLQATLPDVNLTDGTLDANQRLSASTDEFVEHSEQDERRQLAKASLDLATLIPALPGGSYNVSVGPLSLDVTTVSYNLGPQLNVTQDVQAVPVTMENGLTYRFFDLDGQPLSTTVTINGAQYAGGASVHEVSFNNGDQVVVGGVNYDGNAGNDPIIVQPSLTMASRFSNDIGLDVELEGLLDALSLRLSAFDIDIVNVGPLIRHRHTLAEADIGSIFRRAFDLPTQTVPLESFHLFDQMSDGKTLNTALQTQPTSAANVASVSIDAVRQSVPTFISTELVDPAAPEEFFQTLTVAVSGATVSGRPEVLDDRLTVTDGASSNEYVIGGFTEQMINQRSSGVFVLRFDSSGSATVTTTRSNPASRTPAPMASEDNAPTVSDARFDQIGVRSVLSNDIDKNGHVDPQTDGVLLIRRLAGFSGSALTQGALGDNAQRTDPTEIAEFIDSLMNTAYRNERGTVSKTLDLDDDDGEASALGDGILLTRYMAGLRGSELTNGVLGSGARRTDPGQIVSYIEYGRSSASEEDSAGFEQAIDRSGGDPLGLRTGPLVDPNAVLGSSGLIPVLGMTGSSPEILEYDLSTFGQPVNYVETYFDTVDAGNLASRSAEGSPASFADESRKQLIDSGGANQMLVQQTVPGTLGVTDPIFVQGPDAGTLEFQTFDGYSFHTLTLDPRVGGNQFLPSEFDLFVFENDTWLDAGLITSADPGQAGIDGNLTITFDGAEVSRFRLVSHALQNQELHDAANTAAPSLTLTTGFTLNVPSGSPPVPTVHRTLVTPRTALSEIGPISIVNPVSASSDQPVLTEFHVRRIVYGRGQQAVYSYSYDPRVLSDATSFDVSSTEFVTIDGHDNVADTLRISTAGGSVPTPIHFQAGFRDDWVVISGNGVVLDLVDRSNQSRPATLQEAQATPLQLSDVEWIDVRGDGPNTLLLDVQAVLDNDPYDGRLTVLRTADDIIEMGSGWTLDGTESVDGFDFDVYVNGHATLLLQQIPANVPAPDAFDESLAAPATTTEATGVSSDVLVDPALVSLSETLDATRSQSVFESPGESPPRPGVAVADIPAPVAELDKLFAKESDAMSPVTPSMSVDDLQAFAANGVLEMPWLDLEIDWPTV